VRYDINFIMFVSGRTSTVFTGRTTCWWCGTYRGMQRSGARSLRSIGRFQALERTTGMLAVGTGLKLVSRHFVARTFE